MRTYKLISFYVLILVFALHDQGVKHLEDFSVNLSILYFAGVYSFILFWMYVAYIEAGRYRRLIAVLSGPIIVRLVLNLISINKTYSEYNELVNNEVIDYSTWVGLIIGTLIVIWHGYITSRRL